MNKVSIHSTEQGRPQHFGFLVVPNFPLVPYASAIETLRMANQIKQEKLYTWESITIDGKPVTASCGLEVLPKRAMTDSAQRANLAERIGTPCKAVILAVEVMENHLADPLTLGQLAQISNVSARQLNRLFRQHLAINTMAFYRNLRLDKAHRLLVSAPLTVAEIALATGFSSAAHFSSLFKRKFSCPPSISRRHAISPHLVDSR